MADRRHPDGTGLKELLMRYTPAALALSLLAAVTASVGHGRRAAARPARRRAGRRRRAASSPRARCRRRSTASRPRWRSIRRTPAIYLDLAEAARASGLQGKAIHYYREALERDPEQLRRDLGRGRGAAREGRGRQGPPQPRAAAVAVRRQLQPKPSSSPPRSQRGPQPRGADRRGGRARRRW